MASGHRKWVGSAEARRGAAARLRRAAPSALAATLLLASLPAWALRWPWHHRATAASAAPVRVLAISPASAVAQAPQSWDGDALRVDLTRLSGEGAVTLAPLPGQRWPIRLEFAVRPGAIGRLEVQAAQRVVYLVPAAGATLTVRLDPGVYLPDTPRITLRWRAAGDLAH